MPTIIGSAYVERGRQHFAPVEQSRWYAGGSRALTRNNGYASLHCCTRPSTYRRGQDYETAVPEGEGVVRQSRIDSQSLCYGRYDASS